MIFVTVGTHEQQFNRLVQEIDELKKDNIIKEEVFIQTGYSTYKPKYCKWQKIISYEEMEEKINSARIIVTHGGPASFIAPLSKGKIPIVMPRKKEFAEHVNNHQIEFALEVEARQKNIIVVENKEKLKEAILNYDKQIKNYNNKLQSNNKKFNEKLKKEIQKLL